MAAEVVMNIVGDRETLKLSSHDLQKAEAGFDSITNSPVVFFRFTKEGGSRFGIFTSSHVGKKIQIKVCDKLISSPVIREPILGGSGMLSGIHTSEEATELAVILNTGKCK